MKITDLQLRLSDPVDFPVSKWADALNVMPKTSSRGVLQVFTDEGVTGLATAGGSLAGPSGDAMDRVLIEELLGPHVVGEDPLNTERIWDKMYWATLNYGRRGAVISAISKIDIALWDLKGKILNQPVHKLLGGHRDSVAAYGSGINLSHTPEELIKQMTDFVADGFKMVKMKIGKRDPNEDLERVRMVREAIGPNVDLALDVNNCWSLATAIRMAGKLEKYDIYWLEEPILADEIDNLAKLANETSIPIAVGETHYAKWEFKDLMERGAVEIVQADIGKCGGVTEWIKIAAMADAYGLPVCPHAGGNLAASLVAAVPNGLFCECFPALGTQAKDGEISPSSKPGFGIEISEEALKGMKAAPSPKKYTGGWAKRGWRWPPYL